MSRLKEIIGGFGRVEGTTLRLEGVAERPFVAVDPAELTIEAAAGAVAQLVVLHRHAGTARMQLTLHEGARLTVTEWFAAPVAASWTTTQAAGSELRTTTLQLAGAEASYRTELNGPHAASELHALFLAGGEERCAVRLHTAHNAADCRSESVVKGVAGGTATGCFEGLVYVAPAAQRTDARQQSRNILLSDGARIDTLPQLEIYADDVKCSHGATVGQLDDEPILYMRQRGLSEATARRLQIEGFAADVVQHCAVEGLVELLREAVAGKMGQL